MADEVTTPCFLCEREAQTADGVPYYRFYDPAEERWSSEAICFVCLEKLKGPIKPFTVKRGEG